MAPQAGSPLAGAQLLPAAVPNKVLIIVLSPVPGSRTVTV